MSAHRTRQPHLLVRRTAFLPVLLIAVLLVGSNARLLGISVQADEELQVSASFADKQVAAPDEEIEFRLNRPLKKGEGTIAVIVGQADLTALFTLTDKSLRYNSNMLPLPAGESEVVLYLVSPANKWEEVAKFTLNVETKNPPEKAAEAQPIPQGPSNDKSIQVDAAQPVPKGEVQQGPASEKKPHEKSSKPIPSASPAQSGPPAQTGSNGNAPQKRLGFDKLDLIPSLTLSVNSQPAQSNFPAANRPNRPIFTDLNLQASFKTEMDRGLFGSQTQFDLVGSSFSKEALRFGQLGDQAPQVDLSSYLMQMKVGKTRYQAGHFSFGTNRHLMNGFSSRGVMMSTPLGSHADFAVSAMNGTSIVGYSNFFGLDKSRHQLLSGTLGFEFISKRPGGLRLETSLLNGWVQPVNSFSQGSVNDAERSRGLGLRLLASDPAQRFKLDTGFARSRFTSPSDPLLSQGRDLKPFPSLARNARYLDASCDILKNLELTKDRRINLTFAFRHERVDPLYRSLGASTQADKFSDDFSLVGAVGELNAQFTHTRFNDNLNSIPSILRSLTRANTFLIGVPTATLFGSKVKPSPFLPRLSYNFNRTHQFAASIPVQGGFELDPGSVPDQVGTNQSISADWQIQKWRLGYRLNHSFQDNQQAGRQAADLANMVNGFTLGVSPSGALDLNFDLNAERSNNLEARAIDRTLRFAPGINWRMSRRATLASSFSITLAGDEANTKRNRNIDFDLQWAHQFGFEKDRFRRLKGQFFIRYANHYGRVRNSVFVTGDLQESRIVNAGLSLNLF